MPKLAPLVHLGAEFVVNKPATSLLAIMLSGLVFISGLINFDLNASTRDYLGKDKPIVQGLIALEQEYVEDNNIFLMVKKLRGQSLTNKH